MATYTLHHELTDSTCEDAFTSYSNKATAIRVAKIIAKEPGFMVARILVCKNDLTIASFEVKGA